ncbi:MAG: leucine-rich repeat protein [Ruminococcus sp.]|nr:leucine-rich repeat protein [Ruminococcus sp.]
MKKRILSVILCLVMMITVIFSVSISFNAETAEIQVEPKVEVIKNNDENISYDTAQESSTEQTDNRTKNDKSDIVSVGEVPYDIEYDGVRYDVNYLGTLDIVGYNPETLKEHVVIPSTLKGKTVTTIISGEYYGPFCDAKLKSIVLPPTITNIYPKSFAYCYDLESVTMQCKITEIGSETFAYCNKLVEVIFPDSLKYIGSEAFYGCSSLKSIELPKNLLEIGESAFRGCNSLEKVTINPALETIGIEAFSELESLTDVSFEGKNTNLAIESWGFSRCPNLVNIDFSCIKSIGKSAFSKCVGLKNIEIGAIENSSLDETSFYECTSLESVILSKYIKTIPSQCFYRCTNLKSVTMPSVTSIGVSAFEGCSSIESFDLTKANVLRENAFNECSNLKEITFSDKVTYTMEAGLFKNCTSLKAVKLPSTLTDLPSSCFNACAALESIEAKSLINIGYGVFSGCINLKEFSFATNNKIKTVGGNAFARCYGLTEISLPYVTTIGETAFIDCENLYKVEIGKNLTRIGERAFYNCYSLAHISLPSSTKYIYDEAFENCYSLSKVTLNEGLKEIGERAFFNCFSLYDIYIPKSVKTIEKMALGCFEEKGQYYAYTGFTVIGLASSLADEYAKAYGVKYANGLSAPEITSVTNTNSGIKINFEKLSGMSGYYRVYRKTAGTTWSKLADVTTASYTDTTAKAGTKYTYTVKFIGYDGTTSLYDKTGLSTTRLVTPSGVKTESIENGVKLTWSKVAGATKYRVYYKTSSGWKGIGDTSSNSFVHTAVKNNTSYTYTVKAFDKANNSSSFNSKGWSIKYLETPRITSVTNAQNGVKITWGKVAGAENYRVYVKTSTGWKGLGNTTSTSYTYTGVSSKNAMTYTVRCMSKDGKKTTSGYDKEGFTHTFLAPPKVSKFTNTTDGVKLTWNKVSGAVKYRIYVKTSSSWKGIGDTSDNYFIHTDAQSGKSYTYTLKAFDKNGVSSSFISKGFTNKFIATPAISAITNTDSAMKITWGKVTGAENYRVYVKTSTGWKGLANTTSTTYTHKNVASGTNYTYTVRCMTKDGKTALSDYDKNGKSYTYLSKPSITKIENVEDGVKITISKVTGATKYRVYIRENGTWKSIGESVTTTFIHTDALSGTSYTYTVKAFKNDVASSTHNSSGWSNTFISTPEISFYDCTDDGVFLRWDKVRGAEKYRVYVKGENDSTWRKLADTTSTEFIHKDVVQGEIYTYTVRCISSDAKKFTSGYDKKGEEIFYEV